MRSESRCQVRPLSGVDECHVLKGREVPLRVGAKTERQTPRRVRHSASDRTPDKTQSSGASGRDPREGGQNPPGQSRASQGAPHVWTRVASPSCPRIQASQCSHPKGPNRPSKTISHHGARAGENATDPRNQSRATVDKEAQHQRRSTRSCSWTPRQLRAHGAPKRACQISRHMERLAALRRRRRRLSRARRLAPAASARWATAAAAPPGGGARP